ncbi:uncharacterized protein DNG_10468 [Cephalotrichum gorgonifer]|uniref:AB hydrolase-1 domain-containing protein n=1 Tax=Cephalotrichum gorgonifer TaxID=2041049 RepID=A0AAE8N911_9PEZI|nr:uncharacterized protein DNG_10468 [Cephalotrichum gorgonifer]
MAPKPTLVFVPGSWHCSEAWNKVITELEAKRYYCVSVTLPSTLSDPSATFLSDVEAVRQSITEETSQGWDVVVVAHSYGGHVASSAVKALTKPAPSSSTEDSSGHVIGIALVASVFTDTGVGFLEVLGGKPPPSWRADVESGFAVITDDPKESFYHDLPEEEASYWVGKLTKQALKPLAEGAEYAYSGWRDVPVWYLATKEDKVLPIDTQRLLVQSTKDAGADVTLREVEGSHYPMLSRPKETAEFLLDAVEYFRK